MEKQYPSITQPKLFNNEINEEYKISVNISYFHYDIFNSDKENLLKNDFKKLKGEDATFLNRIIYNYFKANLYPVNMGDIYAEQVNRWTQALEKNLTKPKTDNTTIYNIIDDLSKDFIRSKQTEFKPIRDGVQKRFVVQKDLRDRLNTYTAQEILYKVFPVTSKLFNAILSNYFSLPYVEREKIFYYDTLEQLERLMKAKSEISFRDFDDNIIALVPFHILTDTSSTYNYIVGYSIEQQNVISFRISRINDATIIKKTALDVKTYNDMKGTVKLALKERNVQFLQSEAEEITIELTNDGIKKFNNFIYLRPQKIETENKHIYKFYTSSYHILAYFTKFGEDAKILSPEKLKEEFKQFYKNAYEKYNR